MNSMWEDPYPTPIVKCTIMILPKKSRRLKITLEICKCIIWFSIVIDVLCTTNFEQFFPLIISSKRCHNKHDCLHLLIYFLSFNANTPFVFLLINLYHMENK